MLNIKCLKVIMRKRVDGKVIEIRCQKQSRHSGRCSRTS
jgi:hypothetical protein